MRAVRRLLKELFSKLRSRGSPARSAEELSADFATRYLNFKLLITANNRAHEIRTELEKALEGAQPFDMSFVRSRCTALSVNVFRVIKYLDELAPAKYTELYNPFKQIQERINESLASTISSGEEGPIVIPLRAVDAGMVDQVGSKMANVAEMRNKLGIPVPSGFVVTASGYNAFFRYNNLSAEIPRRIQAADIAEPEDLFRLSSDLQRLIISSPLPPELEGAILQAYKNMEAEAGPMVKVSVRSSALGEDAEGRSFAGQFRSILNLSEDSIIEGYKEVVASKYSLTAITYRLNMGIPDEDVLVCVGCMAMVDAECGGVMYSSNPLNIRDRAVVINSVWGLPKGVVDGTVDPDVILVSKEEPRKILQRKISVKGRELVCDPVEGVCRLEMTGQRASAQSASDATCLELASLAVRLEEYYGSPQDIEWAVSSDGSISILQCRPLLVSSIARASRAADPDNLIAPVLAQGGVTASSGVACGEPFIVRSDADKLRFPEGAVLVTAQALPAWAPVLGRSAAVVTEVGGIAGHLANVARELGIPALFGVPNATRILGPGQLVTVDADGRAIYKDRVESLLGGQTKKKNLMQGSRVYETLRQVSAHIVPLNLLDPDSPGFHAKMCKTLHDISRFAHEKAVHEMFSFGKGEKFSERSSKQLWYNGPMQWWIINLEDGFNRTVREKFVRLEDIVSIPMLALWDGMVAVPWQGPPPVDARGFMSVLIQATANPALDPAMSSPYFNRNYFMISRNFCSLTSRFGFHFSTVEALVSERTSENYVSFSFKGGAADEVRKARRASFIGHFLEEFDFRVEVTNDNLFARLEHRDQHYMQERLRILGYLIMHTRQLDMVMSNGGEVRKYREKFMIDVQTILRPSVQAGESSPEF
jgi:pyruvate,water dikinase